MPKPLAAWNRLRAHALSLPEAYEDFPWGDRVGKVRKKIFVFLGEGEAGSSIGMKLGESHAAVSGMPGVQPMGYGMGKAGWVTMPLRGGPPLELMIDWITESYLLTAPKRLAAQVQAAEKRPQR